MPIFHITTRPVPSLLFCILKLQSGNENLHKKWFDQCCAFSVLNSFPNNTIQQSCSPKWPSHVTLCLHLKFHFPMTWHQHTTPRPWLLLPCVRVGEGNASCGNVVLWLREAIHSTESRKDMAQGCWVCHNAVWLRGREESGRAQHFYKLLKIMTPKSINKIMVRHLYSNHIQPRCQQLQLTVKGTTTVCFL